MRNDFGSNYLAHHGILGMSWGTRNGPPYPLAASDHSAAEKKAGWMKSLKAKSEAKKKAKKQKANLEKARAAKATKQKEAQKEKEFQKNKEKILNSGSASEILKYKGNLTNQELSSALNRIQWEKQLGQIAASEQKSSFDKIDNLMNKVGKMTDWVNKGVNAYNAIDKAVKVFSGEKPEEKKEEKVSARVQKMLDRLDAAEIKSNIDSMNTLERKKALEALNVHKNLKNFNY